MQYTLWIVYIIAHGNPVWELNNKMYDCLYDNGAICSGYVSKKVLNESFYESI